MSSNHTPKGPQPREGSGKMVQNMIRDNNPKKSGQAVPPAMKQTRGK